MTPARVREDLHAIETHQDVGTRIGSARHFRYDQSLSEPRGSKQLFAKFDSDASVDGADDRVSERYFGLQRLAGAMQLFSSGRSYLPSNRVDQTRQVMVFNLSVFGPGREPTEFAVVPVICHPHLRSDEEDLAIMYNYAAVVDDVLVSNWPKVESVLGSSGFVR